MVIVLIGTNQYSSCLLSHPITLHGKQIPIKQAWLALYEWEATGSYNTNKLQWTCSCGAQKYHSYLLCKHLVKAVGRPEPDWWATVVRHHVPPFYDVRALLPHEERLRVPEPEELGNRSWLAMTPVVANAPTVSLLPVCIV